MYIKLREKILLNNIIKDLFPTTEPPVSDLDKLIAKIKENILQRKLQPKEEFIQKIIQLYDTIQVRHGLMLVGPAGGGKSCNYKVLQESLTRLADAQTYFKTQTRIMNPKSIKKGEFRYERVFHPIEEICIFAL